MSFYVLKGRFGGIQYIFDSVLPPNKIVKSTDWVGFEPTTSASMFSIFSYSQLWMKIVSFKSHPVHFFFFLHIP
jgi:hypothetical protein